MKIRTILAIALLGVSPLLTAGSAFLEQLATETNVQNQINMFFTVFPDPATTYPTLTEIDSLVSLVFEQTLGLPSSLMGPIRSYYAYLKQNAVNGQLLQIMVPNPNGKGQLPLPFALNNAQEQLQIAQQYNDTSSVASWTAQIATLNTQKQQAVSTLGPQIVDLCLTTTDWQNHLKIFLANSFSYELQLLGDINQNEIKMFSFIPQFETSYYSQTYTALRNDSEFVRIFLVMTDTLRQRVLTQCKDWQTITDPAALYEAIETFKESDFYQFAKQFETISSQTQLTPLQHFALIPGTGENPPSVPQGYSRFLTYTQTATGQAPVVTPALGMNPLFSITNNVPSLTAFGSFLLTEGIVTTTITGTTSSSSATPAYGLNPTPNFEKLFMENPDGAGSLPTALFMELLSFTAINLLNQNNGYLFNQANLADTMQRLSLLETNTALASFPNLIFYKPQDQLLLEDINALSVAPIPGPSGGTATPANFWDDLASPFEDAYNDVIKPAGDDIYNDVIKPVYNNVLKPIGNVITNDIPAGLDDFGHYVQAGTSWALNGVIYLAKAAPAFIQKGINEAQNLVNKVAQVAEKYAAIGFSYVGKAVAFITQDPQLGDDISGLLDSVADLLLDATADLTNLAIQVEGNLVKLSVEGVALITTTVVGTINAVVTGNYSSLGDTLKDAANSFAQDIVSSLLSSLTLCGTFVKDALKNVMVGIGYLTASLTDIVTDLAEGFAALGVLIATGSPAAAKTELDSVRHTMNEHRRLISSIVGTVLMIAITVATLGTAGPLMAVAMVGLTVAMMVPNMMGGNQQDLDAMAKLKVEQDLVASFSTYVQQCGPAQQAIQTTVLAETTARLKEQTINANRGLLYYENYINNSLNASRAVQAYQLSSFYDVLITPDTINFPPTGLMPADPGYPVGIQTNRLELNPSQGFRVYNAGRGTFAQEIATIPASLLTQEQQTNTFSTAAKSSSISQHFITQKDLCNFITAQQTVTVRWRIIYESEGDFYIGIYLNKNYLDPNFLHFLHTNFENVAQSNTTYNQQAFDAAWKPLKTFNSYLYNFDYLAQAFVCYRNTDTNHTPALGIYQHLGAGFISQKNQPSQPNWFQRGTWYIMTATATDTQITVAFSQENDPTITWKSQATIQPLATNDSIPYDTLMSNVNYTSKNSFTGSFGVITSGAAVEYEILTPQASVIQTPQRQTANTALTQIMTSIGSPASEVAREQQWMQGLAGNTNPIFGNWKLTALSDLSIAQGIYAYSTPSTNLGLTAPLSDFVVSLANPPAASAVATVGLPLVGSSAQLGQPITTNTPLVVSIVTGNAYNAQGSLVMSYPDALAAYQQQSNPLPTELLSAINAATQAYYAKETKALIFQNVTVTGVLPALKKDVYIYSCPSFTQNLSGSDYLIFVNIPSGGIPGMSQGLAPLAPTNTINSAVSLVTGIVYNLVTGTPATQITQLASSGWNTISITAATGPTYPNTISTYQSLLDAATLSLIQNQTTSYQAAKLKAQQAAIAKQQAQSLPVTTPVTPPTTGTIPSGPSFLPNIFGPSTGTGGGFVG